MKSDRNTSQLVSALCTIYGLGVSDAEHRLTMPCADGLPNQHADSAMQRSQVMSAGCSQGASL